ncbi:MAG: hypothetical protein SOH80_04090 [Eubacteriales bacterium]
MAYQGLYINDTTGNGNPFGFSSVRLTSAGASYGFFRNAASASAAAAGAAVLAGAAVGGASVTAAGRNAEETASASGAADLKTPVYDVYERSPESLRGTAVDPEDTEAAEAALNGTEKEERTPGKVELNPGESDEKKPGRRSSPAECETCKERKYKDGSDEMVSYKTATHISPSEAPARVMAHEGEHVANAYKKAEQHNGKVLSVSVSIHTAVCPECGRVYVSGGETRTKIAYSTDSGDEPKDSGREVLGARLDMTA